jgi:hypothetical protein
LGRRDREFRNSPDTASFPSILKRVHRVRLDRPARPGLNCAASIERFVGQCVDVAMSLFDTFLAQTQLELIFARRLMADIESGALAPTWGMTREQAIAFLADGVAERAEMIERLAPLSSPAPKTGGTDARRTEAETPKRRTKSRK